MVVEKHENSLPIASVFPGKQVARSSDENMKREEVMEVRRERQRYERIVKESGRVNE